MARLIEDATGAWRLEGAVTLATVPALARATARAVRPGATVTVDLSGIDRTGSAALALLLDWRARAMKEQCQLHFIHWPAALSRLAALSNVDELLATPPTACRPDPTAAPAVRRAPPAE